MKKITLSVLAILILSGCKEKEESKLDMGLETVNSAYSEKYRPQFHFTPKEHWMNDPNGLVYNDGIYHLFYQYYPDATVWGPMHWGHAVSKDMVRWEHKPIALYPDEKGFIFSGSAVIDKENTSGFGKDGKVPMVAIFTYFRLDIEKKGGLNTQTQGIAYSLDNGDTWTKYRGNPVIDNPTLKDFRDPKVFWHKETKSWIMALVAGDHVKFYRSSNLREWDNISDFGKGQGAQGGVWECPDLFKLKVEDTNEEKWVLIISIGSGGPNGGSGTQYFIGDFDGTTFISDQKDYKWLDWGTDNYAGVTYNNVPNNDRIFIGWMSNWQYALTTPTKKWRSAMTIPRKLSLKKYGDSYLLLNYPMESINDLIEKPNFEDISLEANGQKVLNYDNLNQTEVSFITDLKNINLKFENTKGEFVSIKFDPVSKLVIVDRTKSGKKDFQQDFGNKLHYMAINELPQESFEVRILMDTSSMELFINDGQFVMTEQLFPNENYTKLNIENNEDSIVMLRDFGIAKISTIW
ncbi:glycoside hydrolase family 32 protein [Croceitalea sp. MTPC9]|uniref:glycoside hydrolase family 32 protein n=1 Tax=unclassified Croceitalea TaxID=2632280 RepID=UPI002B3E8A09|nr:glycoside hydrolase family 32 protein [Croceitalea sp. MTPC6]GMN17045.1 glycoside hydrolase family 32 protein [Croceitalea sp. MTPC9]